MNKPICIAYRVRIADAFNIAWCQLDGELDPNAWSDNTRCGNVVMMRVGSERRLPTCPECRAARKRGQK